jgi:hypothetical protein
MSKTFKIVNGDISDGYHTFDELYEHRCLLFLNLCLNDKNNCYWKPDFENWFCLYWESPQGQISYHLPNKFLHLIDGCITKDEAHTWDGHKGSDVLTRLIAIAKTRGEE